MQMIKISSSNFLVIIGFYIVANGLVNEK
jgi:hypothetical protein